MNVKEIPTEELFKGGALTCAGCGPMIGLKLVLKALGKKTIIISSSGCLTLTATYPYSPYKVPWLHLAIENAGAAATGVLMGMRSQKKEKNVNVVCYSGDGATYDIGFQSLSGMSERYENIIYICYNNSTYANTGYQQSAATPLGAETSTTPPGKELKIGNVMPRKNMARIMAAHGMPYVATACVSYPIDFIQKLQKAAKINGPKFIDLLCPCPPGWDFETSETVEMGRLMVQSGLWPLFEVDNKQFRISMKPQMIPIEEAFKKQQRFSHLKPEHIKEIQRIVSTEWALLNAGKFWEAEEW
jgi:pyruvate ferredoxin oxidoreductase beta subunit